MKKALLIKVILALLITAFIIRQFYTLSDTYIKKHGWLHGEGYHIADMLVFGEKDNIINDTIYFDGKPQAVILHRGYRPIIANYLVVKSLIDDEVGTYHEK